LFLTFGTAWIYKLKDTEEVVSNCHKLPEKLFSREILKPDEICRIYTEIFTMLFKFNPTLNIVLTNSPVRHLKDGAEENQVSKATLFLAVNELVKRFPQVSYFPSYEIMMDDLRDYRFYTDDMVHPNSLAVNYIWNKISNTYMNNETANLMAQIENIVKAKNHRPFNPNTNTHQQFLKKQTLRIETLLEEYPFLDFNTELEYFKET
jgi:hypothetical protein